VAFFFFFGPEDVGVGTGATGMLGPSDAAGKWAGTPCLPAGKHTKTMENHHLSMGKSTIKRHFQ